MGPQHAHYAILIGIDAYPNNPLTSCVRDVSKIKQCLENKLQSVNIQTFTASKSLDPVKTQLLEDPERWPTPRNVTAALARVTSQANNGDFVYVHYSGHGTRVDPALELSNHSTGDLALLLLEDPSTERKLKGPTLAGLLNALVKKGLVVTLVLDCCFSAAVYRNGDASHRYLPYGITPASMRSPAPEDSLVEADSRSGDRDASMRDNWLLNPDGYAILAACGPHESAKAVDSFETSEKGLRYGALSYFLSQTLSKYGLGIKHKDIYQFLCARFRESRRAQHPVLYGNGNQGFFGLIDPYDSIRSIPVIEREGRLQLLAGQAHGLCDGDRFTLSPWSTSKNGAEEKFIAEVISVGGLTSQLNLLGTSRNPHTQCIAVPLSCSYLAKFPIQLQLPRDLPQYNELLVALKERSLTTNIDTGQDPAFRVMLNETDEYEIRNSSGIKLTNLPVMPRDQTDARRLCGVLEHLARFCMAKYLVNQTPTPAFKESFNSHITRAGRPFSPGQQIKAQDKDILELTINNLGDTTLYAHIYNLDSFWEVKGILRGAYEAIPSKQHPHNGNGPFPGRFSKKIRMKVPESMKEHGSCDDIIKVFVTSQPSPTLSDLLELPSLNELKKKQTGSRAGRPDDQESEDWVAFNFPICTYLSQD
ncbi:putative caspase [Copromyces sp. CBS 386.78]|nr:putative caspase [Copromyces sp. CBS 386.78]